MLRRDSRWPFARLYFLNMALALSQPSTVTYCKYDNYAIGYQNINHLERRNSKTCEILVVSDANEIPDPHYAIGHHTLILGYLQSLVVRPHARCWPESTSQQADIEFSRSQFELSRPARDKIELGLDPMADILAARGPPDVDLSDNLITLIRGIRAEATKSAATKENTYGDPWRVDHS